MERSFEITRNKIKTYGDEALRLFDQFFNDAYQEDCADNFRAAMVIDHDALELYAREGKRGCCGSSDAVIIIPTEYGKINVLVGYNYDH